MKLKLIRIPLMTLLLAAMLSQTWSPAAAQEMTCPEHTPVTIDIKPGGYPNSIRLGAQGVIPVAVLSTVNFDASQFTPEMAHLSDATTTTSMNCAGAIAVRWAREDANRDGRPDLIFFFNVSDLDLTPSSTMASFMAHGPYGSGSLHIIGTDSVKVKL